MKQNPIIAKLEAQHRIREREKIGFTIQLCGDLAMIAANEALGMGPGRAEKFARAYAELVEEVGVMMDREVNSSKKSDIEYTKQKIDDRLEKICGDKFQPWEVRYDRP